MRRQPYANRRRGLSLLEVLVALAVFLMSYIALHQLMNLATDHAIEVAYKNRETQLAQRKLAEIYAGVESFQSSGDSAFDDPDDSDYSWSADIDTYPNESNLNTVTVTVTRAYKGNTVKVTMTQLMVNPTILGSAQDVQATPLSSLSSSSSSSSSGTTGSTGTTGTTGATGATGATGSTTPSSSKKP